jgi:hypothetical protein
MHILWGPSIARVDTLRAVQSRIEEEPMLPSAHHANTEQTASDSPDLTFYASLELSRATWLVTCPLPERDRMSKYSTPGGDGGALLGLLANKSRRRTAIPGLMAGKAGGVAGVVRGVMNHIDVRKADTPN